MKERVVIAMLQGDYELLKYPERVETRNSKARIVRMDPVEIREIRKIRNLTPDEPPVNGEAKRDNLEPPSRKKSLRFKLSIFLLCVVTVVGAMDSVIVAACLSAIARDLQGSSVDAYWIGTSFLLAQTITIPIYGTLSDIFGRKILILFAIFVFFSGSVFCATSQSMRWMIAARVVQGLGAGGTLNLVNVIVSDLTELRERGQYLALGALAWAIGTNIGVPIGGAIGMYATWRWIFWINIPLLLVPIVGLTFSLRIRSEHSTFALRLARVDYLGIIVFGGASCAFLIGLTTGGTIHPWNSPAVLVPLILGAITYVAFILIEWKFSREPMIPLRVFVDRTSASAFFTAFLHGLILWCYTYYIIIFFLGAMQHGLLRSSVEVLPGMAYSAPAAMVAGILIKKFLRFRNIIWVGWVMVTVGTGLTVLMQPDSNGGILYGIRIFGSIGAGLLFVTPQVAAQVNQEDKDVGVATSLVIFFRSLGQAFGVAIGGVIFQNQWDKEVGRRIVDGSIPIEFLIESDQAETAYDTISSFPMPVQLDYQWVYADSLRMIWILMTAVAGIGLIGSLASRNESLDKGMTSKHVFKDGPEEKAEVKLPENV